MHDLPSPVAFPAQTVADRSISETALDKPLFAPWPLSLRIAFRFCFVYFGLFCLTTQIFMGMVWFLPDDAPELYARWPLRQVITWTATHIFHIHRDLVFTGSGSGDKTADWILLFLILVVAILATAVWSFLERRTEYAKLHAYFRLFVRFALAGQMFAYGLWKVIPLQMAQPSLSKLLEPIGSLSPMGVLWTSIGAAQHYEIFAGCAELAAGLLLIFPRTTTLGALVAMADMTQVFMLNMTYDVPVKIMSFHLLLLAIFLLAPDLRRLLVFFFRNEPVSASAPSPIFRSRRAARIALAIQLAYAAIVLGFTVRGAYKGWFEFGGGRSKPPLYGLWDAEEYSIDGQSRAPLTTDKERWRWVVIREDRIAVQKMDDSFLFFPLVFDGDKKTFALTDYERQGWHATLTFQRPASDELDVDGEMDAHKIRLHLHRIDAAKKFPLLTAKFHWVNEYPVNQ